MNRKKALIVNPYLIVLLSFLIVIAVGSVLLVFPFSHQDPVNANPGNYWDALFTATSATCVTGACTYEKGFANTMSFWGQLITIVMIQIGGLGFITVLTFVFTLFKRKLQFKDRYFIGQMVNSLNFADVIKFVRKIILITIVCEGAGFLLSLPVFINMFKERLDLALWYSLFHSISAFNNAGFDLFDGTSSLIGNLSVTIDGVIYQTDQWAYYYFCCIMMLLIISGGLSFLVINEVFSFKKRPSQYRAFTKIVLLMTAILIVAGTLIIYISDGRLIKGENGMTLFQALFQSVTCRTAGFITYPQDDLSSAGKLFSGLLMLIGGSPLGTAGGVKTTTIFIVVLSVFALLKGGNLHAFKRSYSKNMIVKAMALMLVVVIVIGLAYLGLTLFGVNENISQAGLKSPLPSLYLYEVFSCIGTTGVFVGIEPYLTVGSKIVLCLVMFLGRLGPMTFFSLFQANLTKEDNNHFSYIEEDFLIG